MTQEVLKLALEALTYIYTETTADEDELIDQAITAIKEALAQTQEPVMWSDYESNGIHHKPVAQPERHALQAKGEHPAPCARHCEANAFKIVIKNLKAQLAQPEQEPVAWLLTDKNINSIQVDSIQRLIDRLKHAHHTDLCVRINGQDEWFQADWLKHMVRATPPQPEQNPMSDEMLQAITDPENQPSQYGTVTLDYHFEKIKKWEDLFERMSNKVLQQPEQEPVAWMDADGNVSDNNDHNCFPIPLYTAPPQRTWVGLTDEKRSQLVTLHHGWNEYGQAIEANLKQQNGYAEENT